jgi:cobalt-precorrin-5B (C1)-methyltransferase
MSRTSLKKGFTTGAAASAAVQAALIRLLTGRAPDQVTISFLDGGLRTVPVHQVICEAGNRCEAVIVKDAGDDPDITHNALIGARVILVPGQRQPVVIKGGKGVGRVTKPGLELAVGEPAINPGPREMMTRAVDSVYEKLGTIDRHPVEITVFVPDGESLAQKTLNARLGIVGGISILGTTGVVTPMSHDAYIATIRAGIGVAAAAGIDTLVFTTGRRSERFAGHLFPQLPSEAFIQTGDFFRAAIEEAVHQPRIRQLIYTVFFGKAVKMALGYEHTHAAKSDMALRTLADWALEITGSRVLADRIGAANTARHAFSYIYPQYPALIDLVGHKIRNNAAGFAGQKVAVRVVILDFEGQVVFDSSGGDDIRDAESNVSAGG